MVRPAPAFKTDQDHGEIADGDWSALRANLVSLLAQVDSKSRAQSTEPTAEMPAPAKSAEQAHPQSADRRTEALKSVRIAVERFSTPEADVAVTDSPNAQAGNPRADLASAIAQIRERTHSGRTEFVPRSAPRQENLSEQQQLGNLARAIAGITSRLERFEVDLHATRESSGEITEIASQVSQLTSVVEMLANAVGETGQVKRLENQIGQLAKLVTQGSKPEISALTKRIDDVAATVERLADMQVQQMGRGAREEGVANTAHTKSMQAIEAGVRNIYDRIDTIENSFALNPEDIERLTRELSAVTSALTSGSGEATSNKLLAHIDALNTRLTQMEVRGAPSAIGDLKADVSALRTIVAEAVEPRFAALESQIKALSGRVSKDEKSTNFSQLEKQVRHLISQMNQAGEQLSGLTEQYAGDAARKDGPAPEELAALVAQRTSEEIARINNSDNAASASALSEMEKRLSQLFAKSAPRSTPESLTEVNLNIARVDDRLARLEQMLSKGLAATPAKSETASAKAASASAAPNVAQPARASSAQVVTKSSSATGNTAPQKATRGRPSQPVDAMPSSPSADTPLRDPGFAAPKQELNSALLDDWSNLSAKPKSPAAPGALSPVDRLEKLGKKLGKSNAPSFDPAHAERPAKPQSSFEQQEKAVFTDQPIKTPPAAREQAPTLSSAANPAIDRNTFIAAARRAALQKNDDTSTDESQSLIGRAFARLQNKSATDANNAEITAHLAPTAESHASADEAVENISAQMGSMDEAEQASNPQRLFSRHRRALLLSACVAVAILLTANLVLRRTASTPDATMVTTQEAPATETEQLAPQPASEGLAPQPMFDPQPTGSVDPFIQLDMTRPSPTHQALPVPLASADLDTALDTTTTQSVRKIEPTPSGAAATALKIAPPPEELGNLGLREAAANGDARAQFEVAAIYTEGRAVTQDYAAAAMWYERSSAQGFAPAQYRLGNLYEHGQGVEQDLEQARLWYQRAAEAGNRMAMHNLAALYAGGALGEQKFPAAAEWFERAANQGMTDSQFNLGMLYARGLGVKQDMATSYKWFAIAARSGDKDAQKALDDVARSLDADAVLKLQDEIAKWTITPIAMEANFAPIGTWSADFDPGATIADRAVVERVQFALNRLGYDVGTPDGVIGPKTTAAIKSFESAVGMNQLGLVNPRLLAVLGSQPV